MNVRPRERHGVLVMQGCRCGNNGAVIRPTLDCDIAVRKDIRVGDAEIDNLPSSVFTEFDDRYLLRRGSQSNQVPQMSFPDASCTEDEYGPLHGAVSGPPTPSLVFQAANCIQHTLRTL